MEAKTFNRLTIIFWGIALYWVGIGSFTEASFLPYSEFLQNNDGSLYMDWFSSAFRFIFYGIFASILIFSLATLTANKLNISVNYFDFSAAFERSTITEE